MTAGAKSALDHMARKQVPRDGSTYITGLENLMSLLARHGFQDANVDEVCDEMPWLASRSTSSHRTMHGKNLSDIRRSLDDAKLCMATLNNLQNRLRKRIELLRETCLPMVLEDGIKTLPNEILSHIFEHGHDMTEGWTFAKCVSQVSHRFRQASLQTPLLWSRLSASYSDDQLQTFLSRSKERDLEICTERPSKLNHSSVPILSPFLKTLHPHANRWVHLQLGDYHVAKTMETLGLNNLPRLRVLHCPNRSINVSSWHLPSLSQILVCRLFEGSALPQTQLTCVTFHFVQNVDLFSFSHAVRSMTGLKNLTVGLTSFFGEIPNFAENQESRNVHTVPIETLQVNIEHFVPRLFAARLYDTLKFLSPSTVEIVLDNLDDERPADFLRCSAGNIFPYGSTIKIGLSSVGTRDTWHELALLPALVETCDIVHTISIDAPMASIANVEYDDQDWTVFASLRHLQLRYCDQLTESEVQLLADKVMEGAEPGTGLQSLEVLSCRNVSEEFLSELSTKVGPKLKWKL